MSNKVMRIFVEKKTGFSVEADALSADFCRTLGIAGLEKLRLLNRYDVAGLTDEQFAQAERLVLSESPVDNIYRGEFTAPDAAAMFALEYLPGQYDQRADFAAQCISLLAPDAAILVSAAKVFVLYGKLSGDDVAKIKNYCINPVETREAKLSRPDSLELQSVHLDAVERLEGFLTLDKAGLKNLSARLGLAMSPEDLAFCQEYFQQEKRLPTITEIRVLDTYWSDHCRHTTFNTLLDEITIIPHKYNTIIQEAFDLYQEHRQALYKEDRPITLMDIATLAMKKLYAEGHLPDLDKSEEVNACGIKVSALIDGQPQDWLVMFKNETHNHPTEIEPFGGAATCLGGAIRDPLSARAWVYQAMRLTGGGDPRATVEETWPGKLPQRKLAQAAAAGYSSYGNQIGLTTGRVQDFYHEGFLAKRMEMGAVIGAVPAAAVNRQTPVPGDLVILLGGPTGRDGCGGATGSSKGHTLDSLASCGAEVQKGNAIAERKMLRLFRDPQVTAMIKRCNDFGAGGVSVAIGELAAGVKINLDRVPKKYEDLDGTELAISESQERMAILVSAADSARFIELANLENLEATVIAQVTADSRMVMEWRGDTIVNLDRRFLDTNGIRQHTRVIVRPPVDEPYFHTTPAGLQLNDWKTAWLTNLSRLEVASQKGLVERFDSTIGRGTLLLPLGGSNQLTPIEGMAALIPAQSDNVGTATVMTYGYNPALAAWSPFYGAMYAVIESVCRAVAMGADPDGIRLSLQEYFEKMLNEESWGKPFSALLGAYLAQAGLDTPAIGGKDSMSGSFLDKHVPPTLISFAVGLADPAHIISPEFKQAGHKAVFLSCEKDEQGMPDFANLKMQFKAIHQAITNKNILAAATVKEGGIAAALSVMCFGNGIGFAFSREINDIGSLFTLQPGGFILELAEGADPEDLFPGLDWLILGETDRQDAITLNGQTINLQEARESWEGTLRGVFPEKTVKAAAPPRKYVYTQTSPVKPLCKTARPRVLIPVSPGTNCEYDTERAFAAAGAQTEIVVLRNRNVADIAAGVRELTAAIGRAQIIALAGGFSAADEPEGSGKFIATMFRNAYLQEATAEFLNKRGGLILGICNGFQALIKLGLLPHGEIRELSPDAPTLTFNAIGRHISTICRTKIVSRLSPWLALDELDSIHHLALSSGEGRFFATDSHIEKLMTAGQIATQYVDAAGQPAMFSPDNPNGSVMAVEGLTSPDGRIFGKMTHSERWAPGLFKNIPGDKQQNIFKAGVNYFA